MKISYIRLMTILTESDLIFRFNEEWQIRKYDATSYYLAISGTGMSAVDFVGLWRGEVVFIEVKNYRDRPEKELERTLAKISGDEPVLLQKFEEKVRESIVGISVIRKFLLRKWIYRVVDRLLHYPRFLDHLLRFERLFWMYLDQKIKSNPRQVHLVLWLELPRVLEHERVAFQTLLVNELSKDFDHMKVVDTTTNHFEDSIEVER